MRHRYSFLDSSLIQALMAGLDMMKLFNQMVLAAGGDVNEAMEWMQYLQDQGYIDEAVDLEEFFASLAEQNLIGADGEGQAPATPSPEGEG